jgi:hypothetical protein
VLNPRVSLFVYPRNVTEIERDIELRAAMNQRKPTKTRTMSAKPRTIRSLSFLFGVPLRRFSGLELGTSGVAAASMWPFHAHDARFSSNFQNNEEDQ